MKAHLTEKALQAYQQQAPATGFLTVHDTKETSLLARVTRDSVRFYCKVHGPRVDGKRPSYTRRIRKDKLAAARREATLLRDKLYHQEPTKPSDPPRRWPLGEVLEQFLIEGPGRKRAASTQADYRRNIRYLDTWVELCITEITNSMIRDRHREITERNGPAVANYVIKNYMALVRFALSREAPVNASTLHAMAGEWNPTRVTELRIHDRHMPGLYAALQTLPAHWRDLFILVMHTGLRPFSEGATLTWDDIDFDDRVLVRHHTKTHRRLYLAMSQQVAELLSGIPQDHELVFHHPHARSGLIVAGGASSMTDRVRSTYKQITGDEVGFTAYQFRKFAATQLRNMAVPGEYIRWILNHRGAGVTEMHYFGRTDVTPIREYMQKLSDQIDALTGDPCELLPGV